VFDILANPEPIQQKQPRPQRRYPASTVTDPHGSTPFIEPDPFPEIDINTYPEMHYDPNNHPVKHQPWRRGDTDGCHDPISAPWRLEAQDIITDAVSLVGGTVVDVTWYMAKCVISIDEKCLSINSSKNGGSPIVNYVDGPEVRIVYPDESDVIGHIWDTSSTSSTTNSNNDDGTTGTTGTTDRYGNFVMEEMYTEEDELLEYEQYDEDTEYEILKSRMPIEYDDATGLPLPNQREPRSRDERVQILRDEYDKQLEEHNLHTGRVEKPNDGMFAHSINTKALSVISQAITTALSNEDVEDRLQILSRHDIILTSPLDNPCILDSQKEYDDAIDLDVYVETRDPWGSNRVLFGKLIDRTALDVIINQNNTGRMVTIPHSMIHQVLLPSGLAKGSARIKAGILSMEYTGDKDEGDEDDEYDMGDDEEYDDDDDDEDGGMGEEYDDEDGGYSDVEEEEVFE
jgi:ribosome maturation factor RimP